MNWLLDENKIFFATPLPELLDPEMEKEYLQMDFETARPYARSLVLMLGALFMLFAIADRSVIQNSYTFTVITCLRILLFMLVLLLYRALDTATNYRRMVLWLTTYKMLASVTFPLIFILYESPSFFIQSFGVLSLILAYYMLPNRWCNMVVCCLFLTAGFSLTSAWIMPEVPFTDWLAVTLYLHLAVAFTSTASYQINCHKRIGFLKEKKLARISVTDETTGLYNKTKFNNEMELWLQKAPREGTTLSIILFDVDNLKLINDSFGHLKGDEILKEIGNTVKKSIPGDSIMARWGGDEFVVLLPGLTEEQTTELARKIHQAIRQNVQINDEPVTCSMGIASLEQVDTPDSLLNRADGNLYRRKHETP